MHDVIELELQPTLKKQLTEEIYLAFLLIKQYIKYKVFMKIEFYPNTKIFELIEYTF